MADDFNDGYFYDDESGSGDYYDNATPDYFSDGTDTFGFGNDVADQSLGDNSFDANDYDSFDSGSGLSLDESQGQTDYGTSDYVPVYDFESLDNPSLSASEENANSGASKSDNGSTDIFDWLDSFFGGGPEPQRQEGSTVKSSGSGSGFSMPSIGGGSSGKQDNSAMGSILSTLGKLGTTFAALQAKSNVGTQTRQTTQRIAASKSAPVSNAQVSLIATAMVGIAALIIFGRKGATA